MSDERRAGIAEGPERIWLQRISEDYKDGWTWCWHDVGECEDPDVEYVRADIAGSAGEEWHPIETAPTKGNPVAWRRPSVAAKRLVDGETLTGFPQMWVYYEVEPSSPSEALYTLPSCAELLEAEAESHLGDIRTFSAGWSAAAAFLRERAWPRRRSSKGSGTQSGERADYIAAALNAYLVPSERRERERRVRPDKREVGGDGRRYRVQRRACDRRSPSKENVPHE